MKVCDSFTISLADNDPKLSRWAADDPNRSRNVVIFWLTGILFTINSFGENYCYKDWIGLSMHVSIIVSEAALNFLRGPFLEMNLEIR